jgi:uncharacterized protein
MILLIYVIAGLLAGLLGGLLGIGGGLITVPSLLLAFHLLDYSSPYLMQTAVGTSLAAMVFTSAVSAYSHYLKQGIDWKILRQFIPGTALGAILGALIASYLPSRILEIIFGISVILVGCYLLFSPTLPEETTQTPPPSHPFIFSFLGVIIGAISTILGIGGGLITVPILTFYGASMRYAIASSALLGFLIAFIGAFSFLSTGLNQVALDYSLGFLYLPAFIVIGLTSCLAALLGAKLTYILPTYILRRIFGVFLILVGSWMIES